MFHLHLTYMVFYSLFVIYDLPIGAIAAQPVIFVFTVICFDDLVVIIIFDDFIIIIINYLLTFNILFGFL